MGSRCGREHEHAETGVSALLRLTLFGGFEPGQTQARLRFRTRKTQVLVAYLALETGHRIRRPTCCPPLGGVPDQQARTACARRSLTSGVLGTAVPVLW